MSVDDESLQPGEAQDMVREAILDAVQKLHAELPMSDTKVEATVKGKNITVVLTAKIDA